LTVKEEDFRPARFLPVSAGASQ